jgi:hypothetical protein
MVCRHCNYRLLCVPSARCLTYPSPRTSVSERVACYRKVRDSNFKQRKLFSLLRDFLISAGSEYRETITEGPTNFMYFRETL